ncbi:unnamed protein product [Anisakis simplex]|uniref:GLTSCR1 domain-containing protein n=1 Tax=Anisakis simplex TaxID=6269 RepID=A0A0M3K4H7_ANISI|nr:unnamed protein product [Anisakis simplex]
MSTQNSTTNNRQSHQNTSSASSLSSVAETIQAVIMNNIRPSNSAESIVPSPSTVAAVPSTASASAGAAITTTTASSTTMTTSTPSTPLFSPPRLPTSSQVASTVNEKRQRRANRLHDYFENANKLVENADTTTPFDNLADALKRLLPFSVYNEPQLSEAILDQFDEDYLRHVVRLSERKNQVEQRLRNIVYNEAMRIVDPIEECLLLSMESEYEKRKLNDERVEVANDSASFVANSDICKHMNEEQWLAAKQKFEALKKPDHILHTTSTTAASASSPFAKQHIHFDYHPFNETEILSKCMSPWPDSDSEQRPDRRPPPSPAPSTSSSSTSSSTLSSSETSTSESENEDEEMDDNETLNSEDSKKRRSAVTVIKKEIDLKLTKQSIKVEIDDDTVHPLNPSICSQQQKEQLSVESGGIKESDCNVVVPQPNDGRECLVESSPSPELTTQSSIASPKKSKHLPCSSVCSSTAPTSRTTTNLDDTRRLRTAIISATSQPSVVPQTKSPAVCGGESRSGNAPSTSTSSRRNSPRLSASRRNSESCPSSSDTAISLSSPKRASLPVSSPSAASTTSSSSVGSVFGKRLPAAAQKSGSGAKAVVNSEKMADRESSTMSADRNDKQKKEIASADGSCHERESTSVNARSQNSRPFRKRRFVAAALTTSVNSSGDDQNGLFSERLTETLLSCENVGENTDNIDNDQQQQQIEISSFKNNDDMVVKSLPPSKSPCTKSSTHANSLSDDNLSQQHQQHHEPPLLARKRQFHSNYSVSSPLSLSEPQQITPKQEVSVSNAIQSPSSSSLSSSSVTVSLTQTQNTQAPSTEEANSHSSTLTSTTVSRRRQLIGSSQEHKQQQQLIDLSHTSPKCSSLSPPPSKKMEPSAVPKGEEQNQSVSELQPQRQAKTTKRNATAEQASSASSSSESQKESNKLAKLRQNAQSPELPLRSVKMEDVLEKMDLTGANTTELQQSEGIVAKEELKSADRCLIAADLSMTDENMSSIQNDEKCVAVRRPIKIKIAFGEGTLRKHEDIDGLNKKKKDKKKSKKRKHHGDHRHHHHHHDSKQHQVEVETNEIIAECSKKVNEIENVDDNKCEEFVASTYDDPSHSRILMRISRKKNHSNTVSPTPPQQNQQQQKQQQQQVVIPANHNRSSELKASNLIHGNDEQPRIPKLKIRIGKSNDREHHDASQIAERQTDVSKKATRAVINFFDKEHSRELNISPDVTLSRNTSLPNIIAEPCSLSSATATTTAVQFSPQSEASDEEAERRLRAQTDKVLNQLSGWSGGGAGGGSGGYETEAARGGSSGGVDTNVAACLGRGAHLAGGRIGTRTEIGTRVSADIQLPMISRQQAPNQMCSQMNRLQNMVNNFGHSQQVQQQQQRCTAAATTVAIPSAAAAAVVAQRTIRERDQEPFARLVGRSPLLKPSANALINNPLAAFNTAAVSQWLSSQKAVFGVNMSNTMQAATSSSSSSSTHQHRAQQHYNNTLAALSQSQQSQASASSLSHLQSFLSSTASSSSSSGNSLSHQQFQQQQQQQPPYRQYPQRHPDSSLQLPGIAGIDSCHIPNARRNNFNSGNIR